TYAEIRPWPITPLRTLPITTDCSGFAEMMARWSGAADPTGNRFNRYGNTDSMLTSSTHIPQAETQPGDFAVFGLHPSQHMVVLMESAAGGNRALCVRTTTCRLGLRPKTAKSPGWVSARGMCCECASIESVFPDPSNPAPLGSAPLHRAIISAKPEQSVVMGRVRGGVIGHGRISA
ncbi:MAG TPA: hypothetical protein VGH96_11145, partial [Streptosporangiaceae bacterium]